MLRRKRAWLIGWLVVLAVAVCVSLPGGQIAVAQQAAPAASGTILLHPDAACTVKIDGKAVGQVQQNGLLSVKVALGQHLVEADGAGGLHWEGVVEVKDTHQIVVPIPLSSAATPTPSPSSAAPRDNPPPNAPPPPTESQAQSKPPCSNGRPILKRGTQPALPPCPDPPPDAPPPAASAPTRSLNPSEALIERAREAAFEFSQKLPNFICQEVMSRFAQRGREPEMSLDVVSADIIYDDGHESYRNVKINDRPTDRGLEEIGGASSTGEFASTLLEIFNPHADAQFRSGGASSISGFSAQVYDFQVRSENSHWMVHSGSQTLAPAYGGSVWIDPTTARVLRIEIQARDIPSDFPMDTVESAVDYSYVSISGTSFLLPAHAESLGCQRGTRVCSHNLIDFRNYHEFKADIKIGN